MKLRLIDRTPSTNRIAMEDLKTRLRDYELTYEVLDADAAGTIPLLELYDVVNFPAVLVTQDDGQLVRLWQQSLPPAADVAHYIGRFVA